MGLQGYELVATEWTFVSLTFILVLLRLYIRCYLRRTYSLADLLVFTGWLFFLVQSILNTRLNSLGLFNHGIETKWPDNNIPKLLGEHTAISIFKLQYAQNAIYYLSMYCLKFALLLFYFDLIGRCNPTTTTTPTTATTIEDGKSTVKTYRFLKFTGALTLVGCIVSTLLNLFACIPVSRNWSPKSSIFCSAGDTPAAQGITIAFHIFTDVFLFVIPVVIVSFSSFPPCSSLSFASSASSAYCFNQMDKKRKIGVCVLFASGLLCIAFAIAVCVSFALDSPSSIRWFLVMWEEFWGVVVVCGTAFERLLTRDVKNWLRSSKQGGSGGGGGINEKNGGGGDGNSHGNRRGDDDDSDGIVEIIPRLGQRQRRVVDDIEANMKFREDDTRLRESLGKGKAAKLDDGSFSTADDHDMIDEEKIAAAAAAAAATQHIEDEETVGGKKRRKMGANRKSTFTVKSSYTIGKDGEIGEIPIMVDYDSFDAEELQRRKSGRSEAGLEVRRQRSIGGKSAKDVDAVNELPQRQRSGRGKERKTALEEQTEEQTEQTDDVVKEDTSWIKF